MEIKTLEFHKNDYNNTVEVVFYIDNEENTFKDYIESEYFDILDFDCIYSEEDILECVSDFLCVYYEEYPDKFKLIENV